MFGFRYIKTLPNVYVMQYRNGKVKREGQGLNLFYFAANSSLVSVPTGSRDEPFMFQETTKDFQEVTIQGRVTYRIKDPKQLATMMNFTLDASAEKYVSDEPENLGARVLQQVQVMMGAQVTGMDLYSTLTGMNSLVKRVQDQLMINREIEALGLEILGLSVLAIKPKPETAKALEAKIRESILREADEAAYGRRNSAVEQERAIRENELQTEIAVEKKKRQVRETQVEAERAIKQKEYEIAQEELESQISLEGQRKTLVDQAAENARTEADVKAYALETAFKAISTTDPKLLEALALNGMDAGRLVAMGFRGLADNAQKIGQLNLTPDLLSELINNGLSK